jgi:hypothetical protein
MASSPNWAHAQSVFGLKAKAAHKMEATLHSAALFAAIYGLSLAMKAGLSQ